MRNEILPAPFLRRHIVADAESVFIIRRLAHEVDGFLRAFLPLFIAALRAENRRDVAERLAAAAPSIDDFDGGGEADGMEKAARHAFLAMVTRERVGVFSADEPLPVDVGDAGRLPEVDGVVHGGAEAAAFLEVGGDLNGEGFFDGHVRLKRHAGVRHLQPFALTGLHDAVRSIAGDKSRVAREFRRVRKIFDAERPPEIGPFGIGNWRRQRVQRGHRLVGLFRRRERRRVAVLFVEPLAADCFRKHGNGAAGGA